MANWSDPRPRTAAFNTASDARAGEYDAGLRRYMLSVYNYMLSGVLLTAIVAMGFSALGFVQYLVSANGRGMSALGWIVMLAPLGIVVRDELWPAADGAGDAATVVLGLCRADGRVAVDDLFGVYRQFGVGRVLLDGGGIRRVEPFRLHHQTRPLGDGHVPDHGRVRAVGGDGAELLHPFGSARPGDLVRGRADLRRADRL